MIIETNYDNNNSFNFYFHKVFSVNWEDQFKKKKPEPYQKKLS